MTGYARTSLRRLSVRGFRSLRALDLEDLPELVILYGPNGAGKSNILRAARLALRAAGLAMPLPASRKTSLVLPIAEASQKLDLRPEDFTHGELPEIRVSLHVALGKKANALLVAPADLQVQELFLSCVFQDTGDRNIRVWFERGDLDGQVDLLGPRHAPGQGYNKVEYVSAGGPLGPPVATPTKEERDRLEVEAAAIRRRYSERALMGERALTALLPGLLQASEAYRSPGGATDPSEQLYEAFLSEDPRTREAAMALGTRLGQAGLFGPAGDPIEIFPIEARSFKERQLRFRHPQHGLLPLRNLGTGQQQVVFLLGQRVLTPYPIGSIEEPEAHLHKTLMEPLARALRASVSPPTGEPDVDQLWIATHHHYFALADHFYEVELDAHGSTQVTRKRRDAAARHFFEPSPYWDTLELLVKNGMSPDVVVYRDPNGNPATAGEVLASLQGDQTLARRFVDAATRAFVLSLGEDEPTP